MPEHYGRTFSELDALTKRPVYPCRLCGRRPVAAHAEIRLRERRPQGVAGKYIATRSLGLCEPCAVTWFEQCVALLHGWSRESLNGDVYGEGAGVLGHA